MRRVSLAVAWLVLAAVGCGDDVIPAPPVELAELGELAQMAACDWAVRCRHVPDRATCERLIDPKDYDVRRALDAVAAGRLRYDPVLGGACVAKNREQACVASQWSSRACRTMFRGSVPSGGTCTSSFECEGRAPCEELQCGAQCCLGVCGTAVPVDEPNLNSIGERCSSHFDCEEDAYGEIDRRCTALPTEAGQRCLFGCAFGDLYCDLDELVCKRFAGLGESCDVDAVSAPPCDAAWSFCDGGRCAARPGVGESCEQASAECIATAYCQDGTCHARGSIGDVCTSGEHCDVACDLDREECVAYQACSLP